MENKIDELLKLTRENNKILRGMRASQRWSSVLSTFYYILIIGSFVGAYYYLQPVIDSLMGSYQNIISAILDTKNSLPNTGSLNIPPETLEGLKGALNI